MPVTIIPLNEADIPGAIDCIQQAFADDPYHHWVFNDRSAVSFPRHPNALPKFLSGLMANSKLRQLTLFDRSSRPSGTASRSVSAACGASAMRFSS